MEFDKSRVYTALNAEDLPIGSKCIFADSLYDLRTKVQGKRYKDFISTLKRINNDCYINIFDGGDFSYNLRLCKIASNFEPANLERVSRGELTVMASLGHTAAMSREEREICLLRARVALAKGKLIGREKAYALHNKANYERKKNDPAEKAKRAAYAKQRFAKIKADPAKYEALLCKQREYRAKNRERLNALAREYQRIRRQTKGRTV